jgi:hypothetical protein
MADVGPQTLLKSIIDPRSIAVKPKGSKHLIDSFFAYFMTEIKLLTDMEPSKHSQGYFDDVSEKLYKRANLGAQVKVGGEYYPFCRRQHDLMAVRSRRHSCHA